MNLKRVLNLFLLATLSLFVLSACSDDSGDNSASTRDDSTSVLDLLANATDTDTEDAENTDSEGEESTDATDEEATDSEVEENTDATDEESTDSEVEESTDATDEDATDSESEESTDSEEEDAIYTDIDDVDPVYAFVSEFGKFYEASNGEITATASSNLEAMFTSYILPLLEDAGASVGGNIARAVSKLVYQAIQQDETAYSNFLSILEDSETFESSFSSWIASYSSVESSIATVLDIVGAKADRITSIVGTLIGELGTSTDNIRANFYYLISCVYVNITYDTTIDGIEEYVDSLIIETYTNKITRAKKSSSIFAAITVDTFDIDTLEFDASDYYEALFR